MKESNEELANTKKAISSPQEETGGEIMVKVSLIEPNRDQQERILMRKNSRNWRSLLKITGFFSRFWYRKREHLMN